MSDLLCRVLKGAFFIPLQEIKKPKLTEVVPCLLSLNYQASESCPGLTLSPLQANAFELCEHSNQCFQYKCAWSRYHAGSLQGLQGWMGPAVPANLPLRAER